MQKNVTLWYLLQVKNPLQQRYASNDAVYSLVVSVTSSRSRVYEVYIDAYLHNTALKVINLTVLLNLPLKIYIICYL